MISIKNLCKSFGDLVVFENFNIDFEENKITVILGESGSGKTTLLNCIANLTDYVGEIDKVKCSYVFQKPNLFNNLTVKENLTLINPNESVVLDIAKKLRIEEKLSSFPKHLSGGQAQRVALARALIYKADLLLCDEPFNSLDLALKFSLLELVKTLHRENPRTTVFITHDIKEAIAIADRIVVIKDGKIIFDEKEVNKKTEKQIFSLLTKGVGIKDN